MAQICPRCGKKVESRFCPDCGLEVNPPSVSSPPSPAPKPKRKHFDLPAGRVFWIMAAVVGIIVVVLGLYGAGVLFDHFTAGLTDLYLNG